MKTRHQPDRSAAFTRGELIIVLTLLAMLSFLWLEGKGGNAKGRTMAAKCMNNLKQIGMSFGSFAAHNNGNYPYENPDSLAYTNASEVWLHFQSLSNELKNPKVLQCPSDARIARALDFNTGSNAGPQSLSILKNKAVSYFVGLDSGNHPDTWLAGDARVEDVGRTRQSVLLLVSDSSKLRWFSPIHDDRPNVVAVRNTRVYQGSKHLMQAPWPVNTTNRLLMPQ